MSQRNLVLEFVEETSLSPAEAVDFVAVGLHGVSQTEWADRRNVSQQAVSQNVDQARKKLAAAEPAESLLCELVSEALSQHAAVLEMERSYIEETGSLQIDLRLGRTTDLVAAADLQLVGDIYPVPTDPQGVPNYEQLNTNMEIISREIESQLEDEIDFSTPDVSSWLVDPVEDTNEYDEIPDEIDVEIVL